MSPVRVRVTLGLLSAGARVVAVDRDSALLDSLMQAIADRELSPQRARTATADVTDSDAVERYMRHAREEFGRLDIVFNNAGIEGVISEIADYPADDYAGVLSVT